MTYDDLLREAEIEQLTVREKPLRSAKGRIFGNRIAIKKDLSETEKACVLAEEIGHYFLLSLKYRLLQQPSTIERSVFNAYMGQSTKIHMV